MSLATRCTACGTVFRVVQDQLKVSEGWVRCGRCQEVFNALEGLFDLEREGGSSRPSPLQPPGAPAAAATGSTSGRTPLDAPAGGGARVPHDEDDAPTTTWPSPWATPSTHGEAQAPATFSGSSADIDIALEPTPSSAFDFDSGHESSGGLAWKESPAPRTRRAPPGTEEGGAGDFADARFNTALLADDPSEDRAEASTLVESPTTAIEAEPAAEAAALPAPEPAAPAFVVEADRAARWRRPGVRIALTLAATALAATLALQIGLQFRDSLAAKWPALREPLAALCVAADCTLAPPRRLDAVVVESSGLAPAVDAPDSYRLSVVLRNRAEHAVAMPAIELSLTDSNGRLIARRVLRAADFGGPADAALPPAAETPLQLTLAARGERISGYAIEIFYP